MSPSSREAIIDIEAVKKDPAYGYNGRLNQILQTE